MPDFLENCNKIIEHLTPSPDTPSATINATLKFNKGVPMLYKAASYNDFLNKKIQIIKIDEFSLLPQLKDPLDTYKGLPISGSFIKGTSTIISIQKSPDYDTYNKYYNITIANNFVNTEYANESVGYLLGTPNQLPVGLTLTGEFDNQYGILINYDANYDEFFTNPTKYLYLPISGDYINGVTWISNIEPVPSDRNEFKDKYMLTIVNDYGYRHNTIYLPPVTVNIGNTNSSNALHLVHIPDATDSDKFYNNKKGIVVKDNNYIDCHCFHDSQDNYAGGGFPSDNLAVGYVVTGPGVPPGTRVEKYNMDSININTNKFSITVTNIIKVIKIELNNPVSGNIFYYSSPPPSVPTSEPPTTQPPTTEPLTTAPPTTAPPTVPPAATKAATALNDAIYTFSISPKTTDSLNTLETTLQNQPASVAKEVDITIANTMLSIYTPNTYTNTDNVLNIMTTTINSTTGNQVVDTAQIPDTLSNLIIPVANGSKVEIGNKTILRGSLTNESGINQTNQISIDNGANWLNYGASIDIGNGVSLIYVNSGSPLIFVNKPNTIFDYIFMYSYFFAFIGAIFFSITSLMDIDISSLMINKNMSIIFNVYVTICALISLFVWYSTPLPSLVTSSINPNVVKQNAN